MTGDYSTPPTSRRPDRRLLVLLAALLVSGVTARLGVWQLDRADQKSQSQSQLDARRALPALSLHETATDATGASRQFDRQVELRGQWLAHGTVFLDNRQMNGRPGFHVVTPLLLNTGDAVMVQRGWVPRDGRDRSRLPRLVLPEGPVTVRGRLVPPPSKLYDFGDAGAGPIRQNLDLAAHGGHLGLSLRPWSVQQTDPVLALESPLLRDWPAPAVDVHKHFGYAAQWFALSALSAGLYVWFQLVRPRLRRADPSAV